MKNSIDRDEFIAKVRDKHYHLSRWANGEQKTPQRYRYFSEQDLIGFFEEMGKDDEITITEERPNVFKLIWAEKYTYAGEALCNENKFYFELAEMPEIDQRRK